jgi:uncharacterized membrane protein
MPRLGLLDDCKSLLSKLHSLQKNKHRVEDELKECFRHQNEIARKARHAEQVAKHVLCHTKVDLSAVHYFLERTLSALGSKVIAIFFAGVVGYAAELTAEELPGLQEPTAMTKTPSLGRIAK